ncbi:MAG TPA: amidohydrolase family protein [Caulobacteraceae bacterium]|nr:amidohydrolase family protein [Caulobacteraceae bacterium]
MIRRLAAAAAALVLAAAGPAWAEPELYWGMTLLDPATERATPNAWILIDGGRIVRTGRGAPPRSIPTARSHDFRGHWALPGLFDTHAHVTLGPLNVRLENGKPVMEAVADPAVTAHNGRWLLAYGVTTIRDPGDRTDLSLAYVRDQQTGRVLGPEALVAGSIIDRSPVPILGLTDAPTAERSVTRMVQDQATAGVDYVKLYAHLPEAEVAEGIAAARASGVRSIGHLESMTWTRAANFGIDSLVHMMPVHPDLLPAGRRAAYAGSTRHGAFSFFEWYEEVDLDSAEIRDMIAALKANRVHVDATLVAFHLAFRGNDSAVRDADLAAAPPTLAANWQAGFRFDAGWKADDYRRAQAVWPKVLRLTRMLWEAGVPMSVGTDMANPFVAPGVSVSREMELHAAAGIPAWAVLRMATIDAARALGVDKRTGRLKAGMEADVVFLRRDPTQDLSALREVAAVLHDGRLLNPQALKQGD